MQERSLERVILCSGSYTCQSCMMEAIPFENVWNLQCSERTGTGPHPQTSLLISHHDSSQRFWLSCVAGGTNVLPPQATHVHDTSYQPDLHQKTISTRKPKWADKSVPRSLPKIPETHQTHSLDACKRIWEKGDHKKASKTKPGSVDSTQHLSPEKTYVCLSKNHPQSAPIE